MHFPWRFVTRRYGWTLQKSLGLRGQLYLVHFRASKFHIYSVHVSRPHTLAHKYLRVEHTRFLESHFLNVKEVSGWFLGIDHWHTIVESNRVPRHSRYQVENVVGTEEGNMGGISVDTILPWGASTNNRAVRTFYIRSIRLRTFKSKHHMNHLETIRCMHKDRAAFSRRKLPYIRIYFSPNYRRWDISWVTRPPTVTAAQKGQVRKEWSWTTLFHCKTR